MNLRGQGALEYLLLIGGAVLIAAVVLTLLSGIGQQAGGGLEESVLAAQCARYGESTSCEASEVDGNVASTDDCDWSAATSSCIPGDGSP